MISILIISAILFFAAKQIHDDKDLVDFSSMIGLVVTPAIVVFLFGILVAALELAPVFLLGGTLLAVAVVFFFSNSIFTWGYKKSGALAAVYLGVSILVNIGLMAIAAA
jgi:hypothetical protein